MSIPKTIDPEGRNVERTANEALVGCGCLVLIVIGLVLATALLGGVAVGS